MWSYQFLTDLSTGYTLYLLGEGIRNGLRDSHLNHGLSFTQNEVKIVAKSLEELKRENAEAEAKPEAVEQEVAEEAGQEVEADEAEPEQEESESEDAEESESEEQAELESWMQSDEQTSQDSEQVFTEHDVAKLRRKLKGKLEEKDTELERLKAEIEQLKSGRQTQQAAQSQLVRPRREDFDYDDDKYDEALERYLVQKIQNELHSGKSKEQQEVELQRQKQQIEQAVESHYQRAAKLVGEGVVSAERYQSADTTFRQSLDRAFPGQGDTIADQVIARLNELGEGGEKVVFKLGIDSAARAKFEELFAKDKSGLSAMAYLGAMQERLNAAKATKKISSAPKPGSKVSGDGGGSAASNALKRKYAEAHKSGDTGKAWQYKRQAKAAGVDTSKW